MNRKDRRNRVKEIKKMLVAQGYDKKERQSLIERYEGKYANPFKEGQSVKINYDAWAEHHNIDRINPKLIEWLNIHKDETFTVEYEQPYSNRGYICLAEDTSQPKWLWSVDDIVSA